MNKKNLLLSVTALLTIIVLGIGTYSYFRRTVNGNVTGQTGNLTLVVNDKNSELDESFNITLSSDDGEYIHPGDKGVFNISVNSNGSVADVDIVLTISRTGLPDNLKFYLDKNYHFEFTTETWVIKKDEDMTMTVPVYWYWDGNVSNTNDTSFMNQIIEAEINVSATISTSRPTLYDTLIENETNGVQSYQSIAINSNSIKGLIKSEQTANDEYPIMFYRGDITNNNIIFGNMCWLIVRTTETGGIKLVYNGLPNDDGSCNNYSGISNVERNEQFFNVFLDHNYISFNENADSPVYVGYMYNDTNKYFTCSERDEYDSSLCLSGTIDVDGYVAHLSDNSIDQETGRHVQNLKDSTVKQKLDAWYEKNLLGTFAENMIEDTVWCNDRSLTANATIDDFKSYEYISFAFEDYIAESNYEFYLTCPRDVDKFTVSSDNGNGDLTYPIGMLTAYEMQIGFMGDYYNGMYSYLVIPVNYDKEMNYMTMTPLYFDGITISVFDDFVGLARPSISIKNGLSVAKGNGSYQTPYHVVNVIY